MDMKAEEYLTSERIWDIQEEIDGNNGVIDEDFIIPLIEEYASLKTKELENGIEILKELCQLKQYKDEVGKDSFYQKRQPELWKLANEFLNQH